VCVIGSCVADLVVRAPRLPEPGETLLGGPFAVYPGGKGANQAVAAARMGAAVAFFGCIGGDDNGRMLRAALEAEGMDLGGLLVRSDVATGVGVITVGEDGENAIVQAPGANMTLTPSDLERARTAIGAADVLVLQLETPLETVERAARLARNAGTTVILNAAPVRALPAELLADVDVLVVNEVEAAAVGGSGSDDPEALVRSLSPTGIGTLVVTAGKRGAWYLRGRDEGGHVQPFEVEAVDTVGAGDAFVGALAARYAAHQAGGGVDAMGLLDALTWAGAAGALAVTKSGAIPSLPRRADVVALLKR
jgi:ribokinase